MGWTFDAVTGGSDFADDARTFSADADAVIARLEQAGFSGREWSKGEIVRVYVKTESGKDCGFVSVRAGGLDFSGLSKQVGTIKALF